MRRVLASAGALLFAAAFFAIPLYVAVSLCAMPCCQEEQPPCCLTQLDVSIDAPVRYVAPQKQIVEIPAPAVDATPRLIAFDPAPVRSDGRSAPLHLLNSVFRI